MTDHSATIRTMNGEPVNGETTADVLASIRRLIAQGDTVSRRDTPPVPRAQHDAAGAAAASPVTGPAQDKPLRLRQDALIPPPEAPTAPRARRLRLATARDAAVDEDTDRAVHAVRGATTTRGHENSLHTLAEPARSEKTAAPDDHRTVPPRRDDPVTQDVRPMAPASPAIREHASRATATADTGATAAAQMAQDAANRRPADDAGDSTALHLFAPADEDIPNGTILRSLLREAIRQELQGEMGGRFSRNLRRVIRQEVSCAIDEAMGRRI